MEPVWKSFESTIIILIITDSLLHIIITLDIAYQKGKDFEIRHVGNISFDECRQPNRRRD